MEDIHALLKEIGLNDTEAKIYVCIAGHPGIKVSEMQRQTGLVRTTSQQSKKGLLKRLGLIQD